MKINLKAGDKVYDTLKGSGIVVSVLKTVLYVRFGRFVIKYDYPHAANFLFIPVRIIK